MQSAPIPPVWNSLEAVKLVAGLLTPIVVAVATYYVRKSMRNMEARLLVSQKVVERRLAVFDQMAPGMNDFYCYFKRVGHWKDLTPPDLIKKKRELDKVLYINRPLFSKEFAQRYFSFVLDDCFRTFTGHAKDAQLRADAEQYRAVAGWRPEWVSCYVSDQAEMRSSQQVETDYERLMTQFTIELGIEPAGAV